MEDTQQRKLEGGRGKTQHITNSRKRSTLPHSAKAQGTQGRKHGKPDTTRAQKKKPAQT